MADGVAEGVVVLSLVTQVKYTNTLLLSFTKEDVEVWVLLVELEIWNSRRGEVEDDGRGGRRRRGRGGRLAPPAGREEDIYLLQEGAWCDVGRLSDVTAGAIAAAFPFVMDKKYR